MEKALKDHDITTVYQLKLYIPLVDPPIYTSKIATLIISDNFTHDECFTY